MKNSFASTFFFLLSFLYLFFLSSSVLVSAQKPKCYPQDQKAIDQIQAAFGINFNGDCCDWEFVSCDTDPPYRVGNFVVFNSNISGQIPAAIGDLSFLSFLSFTNVPNLTGDIPPEIIKLTKLSVLVITKTGISGPIPTFQVLKNFSYLNLSNNSLTGPIPLGLSTWFPNVDTIDLGYNKLTGTIPESLGHLPINNIFSLSHNRLTGTIPKSLGKLNPVRINLAGNRFNGDASFLFGNQTVYMYLQRNNFTFDFSKVEIISQDLSVLDVSHNNLFGRIPQALTNMFLYGKLNVSYNNLCGQIPIGGPLQYFTNKTYFHNKCLCGDPLPPCL